MEMAKFENRFLTPIQGFTQSKIEKAKIQKIAETVENRLKFMKSTEKGL